MTYKIAALYKFIPLADLEGLKVRLIEQCRAQKILGTILLAPEGINGTIAGQAAAIDILIDGISNMAQIGLIEAKFSHASTNPFLRLKIRLKKEIVSLGVADIDPNREVGTYVAPEDWNALISDPDMLVIDTRNHYEVAIGSFEGAQNPQTGSFRELPAYIRKLKQDPTTANKKIAMFCTGGIRCEKASALMLAEGFEDVYHLKGGILNYFAKIPQTRSKWQGECFVFDNRVSVTHELESGHYEMCHACRMPITAADTRSPAYRPGIACPHCAGSRSAEDLARFAERQKQVTLAKARGQSHIGSHAPAQGPKSAQPAGTGAGTHEATHGRLSSNQTSSSPASPDPVSSRPASSIQTSSERTPSAQRSSTHISSAQRSSSQRSSDQRLPNHKSSGRAS